MLPGADTPISLLLGTTLLVFGTDGACFFSFPECLHVLPYICGLWCKTHREIPLGGTSASGPIAAGLVALLNDARLNQGLPSLGHLNPRLYVAEFSRSRAPPYVLIAR